MLNSPKSRHVMDKLFEVALDDDHKHQGVCLKLIADRLVPMSHFEKTKTGGISGITIKMVGATGVDVSAEGSPLPDDIEDAQYRDITDED
jgi:hypothetical protein